MVLSSAMVCDRDRRIADDRRSMFPYDRRRSQTLLRSAICDLRSAIILKPAFTVAVICAVVLLIIGIIAGIFIYRKSFKNNQEGDSTDE